MEGLIFTLGATGLLALCFLFWMQHTKSGRKWLKEL